MSGHSSGPTSTRRARDNEAHAVTLRRALAEAGAELEPAPGPGDGAEPG